MHHTCNNHFTTLSTEPGVSHLLQLPVVRTTKPTNRVVKGGPYVHQDRLVLLNATIRDLCRILSFSIIGAIHNAESGGAVGATR